MTLLHNPVVPGFYPDPSVIRVGDDYYMVTSTFEYFPGVPVLHSRDLVHWRTIGHCLTRPEQVDLEQVPSSRGIWAATIRHHAGTFYMITTVMNRGVCRKFLVTATDPAGPWSDPVFIDHPGIDPSLLFDADGKVYLTSNGKGINQVELDVTTGRCLTEDRTLWRGTGGSWPEGPRLLAKDGWYYLTIAEGGCQYGHIQTIARSRSPWGPFDPCPRNPILTHRDRGGYQIQGLGHMELLTDPQGRWWAFFLGYRMTRHFFYHLGREAYLAPVTWDADGWPVIGNNGTIDLEMEVDLPASQPWPAEPVRDDFTGQTLGLPWVHLRLPRPGSWRLDARPSTLTLLGNAANLSQVDAPAFVGRRQQHFAVRCATELDFAPTRDGEESGLAMYYQEDHHYEVAKLRRGSQDRLIVRRTVSDLSVIVADLPAPTGPLILEIIADKLVYRIGYQVNGSFVELATGRTQGLSCEAAPVGFTGVMLALYATGNGSPAATPAHFAWFDYEPLTPPAPKT